MKKKTIVWSALLCMGSALPASAASCDRACLLQTAKLFNGAMLAHTPDKLDLSADVQIRENTKSITLPESRWYGVKAIRSEGVYADPLLGNVVEHVAAETNAGKMVYIGSRLKVVDGKITEVEINFDDGPRVNAKNLIPYDPFFLTVVPENERSTRAQLAAIITRYFQGLTDHKPVEADYDARCDRFHSGNRITHNGRNGIEAGTGDDGCYESNLGPKPWGPATETRIAVVDPERGIVIGYAVLFYGNSTRRMQINEVFKILDGRIRMVDNIGLMEEGITTSGFTH
ncbi:hypothetical protein [Terriglobus aquaticus]|uniref:DUF8021 domain-containing protein n=1 Tax=Terriglobus aquaticus TaxID=940139 RepID=A0ABW9KMU5_9BACT|nr:hypothetical protein [Terriglobus aquaticus]